jgi:hypothetical protein
VRRYSRMLRVLVAREANWMILRCLAFTRPFVAVGNEGSTSDYITSITLPAPYVMGGMSREQSVSDDIAVRACPMARDWVRWSHSSRDP